MRVLGVPVRVDASWALIGLIVGWVYLDWFGRGGPDVLSYVGAAIAVAGFFASLLAHELGHALASRARGIPVLRIQLYLMGGVTESVGESPRARDDFLIVVMGPVLSLAAGGLFLGLAWLEPPEPLRSAATFLGWGNVLLAVFNLVPGYPLDGGRLLRAVLWGVTGRRHAATRWAARVGQAFALLLGAAGVWLLMRQGGFSGLWEVLLAWFLWRGASDAYTRAGHLERLSRRTVGELMGQAPPALDPAATLADALERVQERPSLIWPVGRPTRGVLTLAAVDRVPDHDWGTVRVEEAALPLEGRTVAPGDSLEDALRDLVAAPEDCLLVVDDGEVVGVLTPSLLGSELLGGPAA